MTDPEKNGMRLERVENAQKRYNTASKSFARMLGKNLTLLVCMLVPLLLIGFVWTEFGPVEIGPKLLSDGILTVTLFAVGEIMMTRLGAQGGKLDTEYLRAKEEYESLAARAFSLGLSRMGEFCDAQIELELERTVKTKLRALRMTAEAWEEIRELSFSEWERRFGRTKAKKLAAIRALKPIELNEAILLFDGTESERGGVPVCAEDYLKSKAHFVKTLIACAFTGLLTVTVAVTLTSDITLARLLYTVFKLVMLLFRMAKGYDRGARAYNTVEVRQYRARSGYLRQYEAFVSPSDTVVSQK